MKIVAILTVDRSLNFPPCVSISLVVERTGAPTRGVDGRETCPATPNAREAR